MSVFGDFQQVWSQRFPESALPSAWEEDIRANLEKHKHKVRLLKEELDKEIIYVEYLERLLSDIEEKKVEKKTDFEENPAGQIDTDSLSNKPDDNIVPTAPPCESPDTETSVNKCISELTSFKSASLQRKTSEPTKSDTSNNDPSSFVTVIEVNGIKNTTVSSSPSKHPPIPPLKPKFRANSLREEGPSRSASAESIRSSSEQLSPADEPYYDVVATDTDEALIKSIGSSTENVFSNSSTLPLHAKHASLQSVGPEPQSPEPQSNYVNIEYFIHKSNMSHDSDEDEQMYQEDIPLRRNNDNGSYASSSSLESSTPATRRKFSQISFTDSERGDGKSSMYKSLLINIIDSESTYVEWLFVFITYMKAIKGTLNTSQPVISLDEFNTIFYKIPELHELHTNFLESLKRHSNKWDTRVGDSFKFMAQNLELYGAFLSNYGRAVDTAKKCSSANTRFADISRNITCKNLSGQPISLEDLLHKPVARVQKNAMVLHDLLKYTPDSSPDYNSFCEALEITQKFLDQFNMIQTKSMFPANDRAQRRLVKNSFIVEFVENSRKLRHLFLFNDVIACAKYKVLFQSSGRNEKYTFELKWFIPVEEILILEESTANPHEVPTTELVSLKSQASNTRDNLRQDEKVGEDKKSRLGRGSTDKLRKRLLELESQLVLVSPNLIFRIKHRNQPKQYTFFLSSEFERTQWVETIKTLQKTSRPPAPSASFSMLDLQGWITACRTYLKTNMGSYLLRSGHDESLLVGDLHITVFDLQGLEYAADVYICIEVDFYGHFFRKAKTKMSCKSNSPQWNENFIIDLEGCENLRILVYRDTGTQSTLFGKHTQQLSRQWLHQNTTEKKLKINGCELRIGLKYIPYEVSPNRRVPSKAGPLFGEKISQICKRQKRDIPFIVSSCVREAERRGMSEVGIYRVSGSASDLGKLRKSFETNPYEAEQLLKEVDIHSVTGILRTYLRELPEALYTDTLYPSLLEAFNSNENLTKRTDLLRDISKKLPKENKATIDFILEHLIRVYQHENENKMSLHNLATVFGPTLLRSSCKLDNKQKNHLASETVDVMAQAGILYCFLQDLNSNFRKDC
ncbi:PREDICTED: active breakpoint cluster region-related protein isoform X2 [Nicrophorus vespilloides]|uniref:Active breakpoint cluster region-related protein isoform X2 n=1 Tax=Nicrophorus vespilloides TaxID=110193 RepID=A0ABM1MMP0_NICVS|nr:PREDICTED: active breakpoint cluster region-related protein isoform X2 [Nicrophorus vespilloides]